MGPPFLQQTPSYPATEALAAKVSQCLHTIRESVKESDGFLPCSSLDILVTAENVTRILEEVEIPKEEFEACRNYVLNQNVRRLFLILVQMTKGTRNWVYLLLDLMDRKVTDDHLPFEFQKSQTDDNPESYVYTRNSDKKLFPYEIPTYDANVFKHHQKEVCVAKFTKETFLSTFPDGQTLPFVEDRNTKIKTGSFSNVRRVEIHESHLDPELQKGCVRSREHFFEMAVKTITFQSDDEDFFRKEAKNLKMVLETYYNLPGLIRPISAYEMDRNNCLLFPWADGGNLIEFWRSSNDVRNNVGRLSSLLGQFRGMVLVLQKLHGNNGRHSDLKPENILWFRRLDCLKISDLGLTKFHEENESTMARNGQGQRTLTPPGTHRYVPPEVNMTENGRLTEVARSRQYDIWSMGCILCDLLIWMVYGYDVLVQFRKAAPQFYDDERQKIHPKVRECLRSVEMVLREAKGGDVANAQLSLLRLVRDKMLAIPVADNYDVRQPGCRETAAEVYRSITAIYQMCEKVPGYLTVVTSPQPPKALVVIHEKNGFLASADSSKNETEKKLNGNSLEPDTVEVNSSDGNNIVPEVTVQKPNDPESSRKDKNSDSQTMSDDQEQSSKIHSVWHSHPDNQFASRFFDVVSWDKVRPPPRRQVDDISLCLDCQMVKETPLFRPQYHLGQLKSSAASCAMCTLLYEAFVRHKYYKNPSALTETVPLHQKGGVVSVQNGPNLLSVFASPHQPATSLSDEVQLGLPQLLEPASPEQMTLLKEWIRECDSTHRCTIDDPDQEDTTMHPKRLLKLGDPLQLVDTDSLPSNKGLPAYVALSHCWGKLTQAQKLCTYKHNVQQMMEAIPLDILPRTFRDAVTVARGIGSDYLWIDSLCIVQDDADDWAVEAAKMGHIFSAAYYTIAATSATSSLDGFLGARPSQEEAILPIQTDSGLLYVRPNLDDFHGDVELGPLNQRGWVLQELALSRRSIFFTSTQVYWMCGETVRTESLSRLENAKAAFIGDAHFPQAVLEYYRDGRQMLVQDLYERYSSLAFTRSADRPVAILGLQDRLSKAFGTRAAHGMLARYFPRLLLWRNASSSRRMAKIIQPPGSRHHPPTWSWFSRDGPIKYLELKFKGVLWETNEFDNPFKSSSVPGSQTVPAVLSALARRLYLTSQEYLVSIIRDEDDDFSHIDDLYGVIIGRDKTSTDASRTPRLHVLVIQHVANRDYYERVGVASLRQDQVDDESSRVLIY